MKDYKEKEETMKKVLQKLVKLDEKQLLVVSGVLYGMELSKSLEKEEGKAS